MVTHRCVIGQRLWLFLFEFFLPAVLILNFILFLSLVDFNRSGLRSGGEVLSRSPGFRGARQNFRGNLLCCLSCLRNPGLLIGGGLQSDIHRSGMNLENPQSESPKRDHVICNAIPVLSILRTKGALTYNGWVARPSGQRCGSFRYPRQSASGGPYFTLEI